MDGDPLKALQIMSAAMRKGSKSRSELQGPSDDPLAGVEAVGYKCDACQYVSNGISEHYPKLGPACTGPWKKLHTTPAVRKAFVEWLRKEILPVVTWPGDFKKVEAKIDRLERGQG